MARRCSIDFFPMKLRGSLRVFHIVFFFKKIKISILIGSIVCHTFLCNYHFKLSTDLLKSTLLAARLAPCTINTFFPISVLCTSVLYFLVYYDGINRMSNILLLQFVLFRRCFFLFSLSNSAF